MDHTIGALVSIATAIVGLAIVSVLVSGNAKTSDVIGAGGQAFSNAIKAAVAPVSGGI